MWGKFDDKNDPLKNACAKYDLVKFENVDKIYNFSKDGSKNGRNIVKFDDKGSLLGKYNTRKNLKETDVMPLILIKELTTKKELTEFVKFPLSLYKNKMRKFLM